MKIGNKFVINEVGQKAIKSMFLTGNENLNRQPVCEKTKTENHKNANQVSDLELLPFLKKQLDQKDIQLHEKDTQIKQIQKLLDQQQQLTLQANHQIEQLQKQLQLTYEKTSEKETTILSKERDLLDKQHAAEKKWWQIWKK